MTSVQEALRKALQSKRAAVIAANVEEKAKRREQATAPATRKVKIKHVVCNNCGCTTSYDGFLQGGCNPEFCKCPPNRQPDLQTFNVEIDVGLIREIGED